ncbi:hypothetical protein [Dyella sp. Tek66A03]|uniref:hypothetical protein n=1 Tax=Dyella sp. Tek66A03 TaxID=3458298 RepID=UPI00403E8FDC
MPVQLLLDDDGGIPIPLDDCTQEAWMLQFERACQSGAVDGFRERLAHCFATSLVECLDADLKPPTEAQLKYATAIARELGIALPSETLRFRGPMAEFIDRFADAMKQKRRSYLRQETP